MKALFVNGPLAGQISELVLECIANRRQSNDDEPVRTPYEGATL